MSLSPSALWLIAGIVLCSIEAVVPTAFTAFVMGISAFLVALVALLLPSKVGLQIFLWMVFSTIFVFISHRLISKRKVRAILDATEAQTLTEILPGQTGRVLYEGNSWRARCGETTCAIESDRKVYVVGREGTTLIVMPEDLE
jgi:membrane protein implicated in regulation of membrane protease activity